MARPTSPGATASPRTPVSRPCRATSPTSTCRARSSAGSASGAARTSRPPASSRSSARRARSSVAPRPRSPRPPSSPPGCGRPATSGSSAAAPRASSVTPAQHRVVTPGDATAIRRLYSSLDLRLFYANDNATDAALVTAPAISDVRASQVGSNIEFSVRVHGTDDVGADNLRSAWVTYTYGSAGCSCWQSIDLDPQRDGRRHLDGLAARRRQRRERAAVHRPVHQRRRARRHPATTTAPTTRWPAPRPAYRSRPSSSSARRPRRARMAARSTCPRR